MTTTTRLRVDYHHRGCAGFGSILYEQSAGPSQITPGTLLCIELCCVWLCDRNCIFFSFFSIFSGMTPGLNWSTEIVNEQIFLKTKNWFDSNPTRSVGMLTNVRRIARSASSWSVLLQHHLRVQREQHDKANSLALLSAPVCSGGHNFSFQHKQVNQHPPWTSSLAFSLLPFSGRHLPSPLSNPGLSPACALPPLLPQLLLLNPPHP